MHLSKANIPVLRTAHQIAGLGLRGAGYRFELFESSGHKLGLWRKTLSGKKSGRAFVLVPGFGDTPISWVPLLHRLSRRKTLEERFSELVLLDFPGFSGFLSEEKPISSLGSMRALFRDVCGMLRPDTLLGHSLGGWLAAAYASEFHGGPGDGPHQIIGVCPAGVARSPETRLAFERKVDRLLNEGFETWRPYLFAREPFWFQFMDSEFSRFITRDGIREFIESMRREHFGLAPLLGQVDCAVSLIWGAEDGLIPAACAGAWEEHLPKPCAGVIMLEGVGHSPQLEDPGALADAIATVLAHPGVVRPTREPAPEPPR